MAGFWQRMVDGAPRQLRFTTAGKVLIGIALFAGLAAMNTGNNLLFLVWGLVLSAIVISGVLSEAALRSLQAQVKLAPMYRALQSHPIEITVENSSAYLPAFGLRPRLDWLTPLQPETDVWPDSSSLGPYLVRLDAKRRQSIQCQWQPIYRGCYRLEHVAMETAYPFGFFIKSRRIQSRLRRAVWVSPAKIPVDDLLLRLRLASGDATTNQRGASDEYLALRPYRHGDDPRRIAWRRSARLGRLISLEMAQLSGQMYVFELHVLAHAPTQRVEQALSVMLSLAERLQEQEVAVGLLAPGVAIPPQTQGRHLQRLAFALAKCQREQPTPQPKWPRTWQRWGLLAPGLHVPAHVHGVLPLPTVYPSPSADQDPLALASPPARVQWAQG